MTRIAEYEKYLIRAKSVLEDELSYDTSNSDLTDGLRVATALALIACAEALGQIIDAIDRLETP